MTQLRNGAAQKALIFLVKKPARHTLRRTGL